MEHVGSASLGNAAFLTGVRGGGLRLRLKHIIMLAVLWSLVIAEFAVLIPAMFVWQREEMARLESEALQLLKANIDPVSFPTIVETMRMGQRLLTFSHVKGGRLVNAIGDEIGVFGEVPALSFQSARRENVPNLLSRDRQRLDVLYSTEVTGLAHHMILRLDASVVPQRVLDRLVEKSAIILIVALISGISVAVILGIFIVKPVLRLRDAAIAATDNPDRAEQNRLRWRRSDELGDAARAFDLLLTAVSLVHQEDLAANQEAMQRSSFAILSYDPNGRLTGANPAALRLFGTATIEELCREPLNYVRIKSVGGTVDLTPLQLLGKGSDVSQLVSVVTSRQEKRCHINATTIHKRNGSVLRHIVTLVDMTKQISFTEHLEDEFERTRDEAEVLRRKVAQMKHLFESCLIIMAGPKDGPDALDLINAPTVSTERIVNNWFAEALRGGLVQAALEHSVLPPMRGKVDDVEALFRQALLTVYVRSNMAYPTIAIDAYRQPDGAARFDIRELDPMQNGPRRADGALGHAGGAIALRALGMMVAKIGGHTLEVDSQGRTNAVSFYVVKEAIGEPPSLTDLADQLSAPPPRRTGLRG